jgi:hypothetical protein
MESPNTFSLVALALFVPAALLVYASLRPTTATAVLALAAMFFLPEGVGFDLRGLPALEKRTLSYLAILLGVLFYASDRFRALVPRNGWDYAMLATMAATVVLNFATALTNRDPVPFAGTLTAYDGVSLSAGDLLHYFAPFCLGWMMFRSSRDLRELLVLLVGFATVYSLGALYEVRMSPQLHNFVYGFHPDKFYHVYRWGGYRPQVFMPNGLALGLAMAIATLAATLLARARVRIRSVPCSAIAAYLGVILVLCKSTAAIVYGLVLAPALALAPARWLSRGAVAIACLVLLYPTLRVTGVFPEQEIVGLASTVSAARAESLAFRFENEDQLVVRALERPWFGWGTKMRPIVFDAEGGNTIADGYWIILFGYRGVGGWACFLGLLLLPVFHAWRAAPRVRDQGDRVLLAGLSVIVATYAFDLLPNGLFANLPMLFAGSLHGLSGSLPFASRRSAAREPGARPAAPAPPEPLPRRRRSLASMR